MTAELLKFAKTLNDSYHDTSGKGGCGTFGVLCKSCQFKEHRHDTTIPCGALLHAQALTAAGYGELGPQAAEIFADIIRMVEGRKGYEVEVHPDIAEALNDILEVIKAIKTKYGVE